MGSSRRHGEIGTTKDLETRLFYIEEQRLGE